VIRRRPIPRTHSYPAQSLRYATILDGALRVYPDGREVCMDSPAGWKEYSRRIDVMLQEQGGKCCLCKNRLYRGDATFEHMRRRGFGAAFRDDSLGRNGVSHWICNYARG
jgi:hypothetical protein